MARLLFETRIHSSGAPVRCSAANTASRTPTGRGRARLDRGRDGLLVFFVGVVLFRVAAAVYLLTDPLVAGPVVHLTLPVTVSHLASHTPRRVVGQWGGAGWAIVRIILVWRGACKFLRGVGCFWDLLVCYRPLASASAREEGKARPIEAYIRRASACREQPAGQLQRSNR